TMMQQVVPTVGDHARRFAQVVEYQLPPVGLGRHANAQRQGKPYPGTRAPGRPAQPPLPLGTGPHPGSGPVMALTMPVPCTDTTGPMRHRGRSLRAGRYMDRLWAGGGPARLAWFGAAPVWARMWTHMCYAVPL